MFVHIQPGVRLSVDHLCEFNECRTMDSGHLPKGQLPKGMLHNG